MSLFSVSVEPSPTQINQAIEKLSPAGREVIACMGPEGFAYRITTLAEYSQVNPTTVRKVLKRLRELNLAEYSPLIDEETGRPCGSGTYLNRLGVAVKEHLISEGQIHA